MRAQTVSTTLLFAAAVCAPVVCALLAAGAPAAAAQVRQEDPAAARRIVRVENGLLPDSPVAGEPGWRLRDRMRRYGVPGVQIAVLRGGRAEWTRGYGTADPRTGRPVTPDTLFDAGSVSKAVTAVAVLRLVDQGRLSLDVPVNDLLRSWKLPDNAFTRKTPVTLRRLLSHTAGVNAGGMWGYLDGEPLPTPRQILDGSPPATNDPIRVVAEPGGPWRYSGGGYVIVQQVIEDVTGRPFAEAADDLVLRPLGMKRSTFVQGLPPALRAAAAVPTSQESYFKGRRLSPFAAAGGLYTSAADLARLVEALYGSLHGRSDFLKVDTARLLVTPVVRDREPWDRVAWANRRNTQKDQAVGLMGMSRTGAPGETVYAYHDGLNAGFRSRLMFDPATGDGAVILYNSDGDEEFLLEATRAVASVYGWKDYLPDPLRPVPATAAELDRYVGRYQRTPDNVVTIRREGGRLTWTDLGTVAQPIYPMGGGVFEHREMFGRPSRFTLGPDGRAASLDGWPRLPDGTPPRPVELLLRGDAAGGAALLRADASLDEGRLAEIGFNLLVRQRMPRAAAPVYAVITERYPGSSAAWDALGDALRRSGDPAGGAAAERRAADLRAVRDRLAQGFETGGVRGGCAAYRAARAAYDRLPFGDTLERLAGRLRDQGKPAEADAAARLYAFDRRVFP